jgi:predicted nucleic acid-binding protein
MPGVLLDTNVLVYTFDPHDIACQEQAISILLKLEEANAGCLSVQNLSEFANVAITKRLLPFDEVLNKLEGWGSVFPVFTLTPLVVLEAVRGVRNYRLSYYDAQIWAVARLNQIPVVFSEDFQDGQTLEGVRFVDPFSTDFDIDEWI